MSPAKTAEPIRMPFGLWSWVGPCIKWEPGSTGEGAILGVVSPLKRIRLCKQQTCQLVRVADLPGRRSLPTTLLGLLVPSVKLSTVGGRAFPVAAGSSSGTACRTT